MTSRKHIDSLAQIKGALFGLSVGDALGVPAEFKSRKELLFSPVKDMQGHGTWNQPPGTWSDDSSLAFCLADSLTTGYDFNDVANKFIKWCNEGYWGAHHRVFDIGNGTNAAISRLIKGTQPILAGGFSEGDNGNGSLMRILPLLFYIKDLSIAERFEKIKEISSLTHAHFRSVLACFIYMEFALLILNGNGLIEAYNIMKKSVNEFLKREEYNTDEVNRFNRILADDISTQNSDTIYSSGYVVHTLEASIWCLLTTETYASAVLKAVNLGEDTDTTACVTGGIAGIYYGYNGLLKDWSYEIARFEDIKELCEKLNQKYYN
jgi:ADP-ribosyl-[dinitrogen reductase] hydrolase